VRAVLRDSPAFRRLFLAHAVSRGGDAFNSVALVVLVFQLTGSGAGVAGTVAFEILPVLLLGPAVGLLVDRYPRWRVMLGADLLRAGLAGLIALHHGSTALAYAVAFGLSTGALLFNPASSSLVPDLLDGEASVVDANAALWTVAVAAQVILAPLAGVLIETLGVGWAFGLNAASYVGSACLLWHLGPDSSESRGAGGGWRQVVVGIQTVRSHPLLAQLALVQVLAALSAGATSGLLVVLAAERFGVGAGGFGLLLSAIAVGAVSGPVLWRRFIRPGARVWLFGPFAVRGVVDLGLAVIATPWLAAPALVAYGMSTSTGMVAYQSTLQIEVAAEVRGRAFALFDVLWNGARLVSLGVGALLADLMGIRAVYALGGLLLLLAAAVGFTGTTQRSSFSVQPRPGGMGAI
jgi:MFS family permease